MGTVLTCVSKTESIARERVLGAMSSGTMEWRSHIRVAVGVTCTDVESGQIAASHAVGKSV